MRHHGFSTRPTLRAIHAAACLLLLAGGSLCAGCGEDRTHEFEEATACGHWMQVAMQENYLWGDSVKDLPWKQYFGDPETVFGRLTEQAPIDDKWSWCSVDTTSSDHHERGYYNHLNSYGLDFVLMNDPTSATSRTYARVTTVYAGSPAEACGIARGHFISTVDGTRFSSSTASKLVSGSSHSLEVLTLGVDDSLSSYIWSDTMQVTLPASAYVEDVPFPVVRSYDAGSTRVVYLMCNRLTEGPEETDPDAQTYRQQLDATMDSIRVLSPQALVLDLRLCNYGSLDMGRRLASYLAPDADASVVFAKLIHRADMAGEDTDICFDADALSKAIPLEQLFIITGDETKGAAEWLVRALKATMGTSYLTTLGATTAGQIVCTSDIGSDYSVTIHPATAYVADKTGDYDYSSGVTPEYEVDELQYVTLYPYGDEREALLSLILESLSE